jgi:hypothetical protein
MHVGTQQKNKQKDDIQKYLRSHAENEKWKQEKKQDKKNLTKRKRKWKKFLSLSFSLCSISSSSSSFSCFASHTFTTHLEENLEPRAHSRFDVQDANVLPVLFAKRH